jgi:hypothetical protein
MKRSIPLVVWVSAIFVILFIPLQIINKGFLPNDDALRFAAKAVSGKTWQQILVMRNGFTLDPNPGWQAFLQWLHDCWGCGSGLLLIFSVVFLMALVMCCALPWFRRPEAWLAALLTASLFVPNCATRFARGRPYLVTDAVLITLLLLWSREEGDKPHRLTLVLTTVLVAASVWIEGAWYLLVLPGVATLFARMWRLAFWYGGCWLTGSFLGSTLTGHPWGFLVQAVRHLFDAFGYNTSSIELAGEFYASAGGIDAILVVAVLLLWRAISPSWSPRVVLNPIFMMMVLGWLLGLEIRRFWWDWGIPALMIWVALELQSHMERYIPSDSTKRLLITLLLAVGTFFGFTADRDSRWTQDMTKDYQYLNPTNPSVAEWLPGPGGIVYNSDMEIFYQMFFRYPTAPWRYVLGFEPGLMRPEDLAVRDKVQLDYFSNVNDYKPWVDKMRPEDRLIIHMNMTSANGPPNLPQLEWKYAGANLWIGRLRRGTGG